MEENPKYIRNVIVVLGLEEVKPVMTPSVKRTPTTESLVELEGERRAMYRTVVGKLLYMCQERADIMHSVKETARKITRPTESDEMNLKRIVRYLKGAPSAKSLIEIITPSKFVNVYTDIAIGQDKLRRARAQVAELCSGETQHSQHGHEHSKQ